MFGLICGLLVGAQFLIPIFYVLINVEMYINSIDIEIYLFERAGDWNDWELSTMLCVHLGRLF